MVQDLIARLLSPLLAGLQPVIVAAFTAAITVGLTFWYRRQYEQRQALVALKAEIFQNNQRLKGFARECHQMDLPFVATPEATTTPYFDTTAYENYRNNGYLFDLHPYDAGAVSNHYNRIKFINRQLQRRDEIYYNLDGEVKGNDDYRQFTISILQSTVHVALERDTFGADDLLEDAHPLWVDLDEEMKKELRAHTKKVIAKYQQKGLNEHIEKVQAGSNDEWNAVSQSLQALQRKVDEFIDDVQADLEQTKLTEDWD